MGKRPDAKPKAKQLFSCPRPRVALAPANRVTQASLIVKHGVLNDVRATFYFEKLNGDCAS